jgi:NADPH:quinone reductase-like Zn-dependent oxidoreductase
MRAVACDRYGPPDVLRLDEVERPAFGVGEVLIKVVATSMTRTDCEFRRGSPLFSRAVTGVRRPKWRVFGYEFAGVVEAVGAGVSEFAAGERVFGVNAGLTPASFGAHAEFLRMPASGPVALLPAGVDFQDAAAVCDGAILALGCLRPAGIGPGLTVLVYGASGSIGTAAVQLASYFGADVTAVCGAANLDLARSLGAGKVLDYTREDFRASGERYDVIFDAVGKLRFWRCRKALKPGGRYLATDLVENMVLAAFTGRFGGIGGIGGRRAGTTGQVVVFPVPPQYGKGDVLFLGELLAAGKYQAVIDRCYPLEMAAEAAKYVETGQKIGNVVLTVA